MTTVPITFKVRNAFIRNLREIFKLDSKYTYIETVDGEHDFDSSKIYISDEVPQDHAAFPAVVTNVISGAEQRYLGPDTYRQTKDGNNVTQTDEIFSSVPLTVTVKVYTIGDSIARDEIVDRIYGNLKLLTTELANDGIEVGKQSFPPHTKVFSGDQWWFTATMTFNIYTEFVEDLGVDETVSSIPITLELIP